MRIENPSGGSGGALMTQGSFTGNNAVNRAIAHGLGKTPKVVYLQQRVTASNAGTRFLTLNVSTGFLSITDAPPGYTPTAADATNFYIGLIGNETNYTIEWQAFG